MFLGIYSFTYDANQFTPANPWGTWIILVPVVGGLVVTFPGDEFRARGGAGAWRPRSHGRDLLSRRARSARGGGGEVRWPRPRRSVPAARSAAKAPIIQIGRLDRLDPGPDHPGWRRGSASRWWRPARGPASPPPFNTPIGRSHVRDELMLPEVSARTFPARGALRPDRDLIGRLFPGLQPAFSVPASPMLGTHAGSAVSLVALRHSRRSVRSGRRPGSFAACIGPKMCSSNIHNPYLRTVSAMLDWSAIYLFFRFFAILRRRFGYATIQAILAQQEGLRFGLLALLFGPAGR